jgi:hypothetical protein
MPYNEALIQYKVYRYRHMYLHLIREPFDRHLPEQNGICRYATRFLGEIPPCAHNVIFVTEFVLLIKTPPFYDVNSFKVENNLCMEEFQKQNYRPLFTIILDQKC